MRSCPVCRSSDHNSQACDACGYSPTSQFIENEEDNNFLAHFEEGRHEFDEGNINLIEMSNPQTVRCGRCHNLTMIPDEGICLYCGYYDPASFYEDYDFELQLRQVC